MKIRMAHPASFDLHWQLLEDQRVSNFLDDGRVHQFSHHDLQDMKPGSHTMQGKRLART